MYAEQMIGYNSRTRNLFRRMSVTLFPELRRTATPDLNHAIFMYPLYIGLRSSHYSHRSVQTDDEHPQKWCLLQTSSAHVARTISGEGVFSFRESLNLCNGGSVEISNSVWALV